jgi:deoxyribonuclease-1
MRIPDPEAYETFSTHQMKIKPIIFICLVLVTLGIPISGMGQNLDADPFQPSSLVSSEIAHKQLQKIYLTSGNRRTFHCSCVFDKLRQVFPNLCSDGPVSGRGKPQKLIWASLMSPNVFAKSLKCWNKNLCARSDRKKVDRSQCCSEISPKFKKMQSDMHNIFPMIEEPVSATETSNFSGLWEYSYCKKEGTLRKEISGDASRAYLYMSFQYKIHLEESLENSLRTWHFVDPPDEWEEKRNDLIEVVQGNRNPFIDQPELVERVRDF